MSSLLQRVAGTARRQDSQLVPATPTEIPPELREMARYQWKHVTFKLIRFTQVPALLAMLVTVFPKKAIGYLLQNTNKEIIQERQNIQTATIGPGLLQGQVLGNPLPPSETGKYSMARDKCPHPLTNLIQRGNKGGYWWTCQLCGARWERRPPTTEEKSNLPVLATRNPKAKAATSTPTSRATSSADGETWNNLPDEETPVDMGVNTQQKRRLWEQALAEQEL
jgi:hypothetical protein